MKDPRIEQLMALAQGGGMPMNGQMSPNGGGILQALMAMGGGASGAPDPRMMQEAMSPRQMASMGGMNEAMSEDLGASRVQPTPLDNWNAGMGQGPRNALADDEAVVNDTMTDAMPGSAPEGVYSKYYPRSDKMSDEQMLDYVQKTMGDDGELGPEQGWEGTRETGPTPADIKYMKQNQTDGVLEDFEKHFGISPNVNEPVDGDVPDDEA